MSIVEAPSLTIHEAPSYFWGDILAVDSGVALARSTLSSRPKLPSYKQHRGTLDRHTFLHLDYELLEGVPPASARIGVRTGVIEVQQ